MCKPCLDDWLQFQTNCYFISKSKHFSGWNTWATSREECRKTNADLVVIDSQEEQVRLINMILYFHILHCHRQRWKSLVYKIDSNLDTQTPWCIHFIVQLKLNHILPKQEKICTKTHKSHISFILKTFLCVSYPLCIFSPICCVASFCVTCTVVVYLLNNYIMIRRRDSCFFLNNCITIVGLHQ